jgi:mandelamide amidase
MNFIYSGVMLTTLTLLSNFAYADGGHNGGGNGNGPRDVTKMTATEIKKALERREITSEMAVRQILNKTKAQSPIHPPAILTDYDDLKARNGLNAYVYMNPNALQEAKQADNRRSRGVSLPLLGVPIAIKDTIPVIGYRNSSGSYTLINHSNPALPGLYQEATDPGIQRLKDAGAIIIGQNNMHEMGGNVTSINFTYGPVKNAHDKKKIAGGSSGGGATAVAAELIPVAIGDDIGGSVRIPPALNGVIGFRPSVVRYLSEENSMYGVPYAPNSVAIPAQENMDVRGVIARSIEDVVLIDQFLSEDGGVTITPRQNLNGVRLGIPENFYQNMEPEVIPVIDSALAKLQSKGATLVSFAQIPYIDPQEPYPIGLLGPMSRFQDVWTNKVGISFGSMKSWSENTGIPIIPVSPDVASGWYFINYVLDTIFADPATQLDDMAAYYNYVLTPITQQARAGFTQFLTENNLDAIIYPTCNLPAADIKEIVTEGGDPYTNGLLDFSYTTTSGRTGPVGGFFAENIALSPYLGIPSLSMPVGFTQGARLPVGMLIEANIGEDAKVLEIGSAFEKIFGVVCASANVATGADVAQPAAVKPQQKWTFKSKAPAAAPKVPVRKAPR